MPWIMKHAIGLVGKVDTGVWICNNLHWCGCCSCGTVLPGYVRRSIALHISLIAALLHSTVQFGPEWQIPRRHWTIKTSRPTYKPVGNLLFMWEFIGFVMFSSIVLLCCVAVSALTRFTRSILPPHCVCFTLCAPCVSHCLLRKVFWFWKAVRCFFFFFFNLVSGAAPNNVVSFSLKKIF